ncbi:unnamed protein product [Zymoseptoria tritici ST99CH_1E4]|uniref:Uncharacterized protein n=1 Tax=Zymoseptoria tritici ST99CH_1E4 TaxID=1276532 RepID=A0A2H1FJZ1_ZYMTR|nr:unnamed protein product [Zymoseptoria tritici ST99CH_1E4]
MAPRFVKGQPKQVPRENAPPSTPRRPPIAPTRPAAVLQSTPGPSANHFARTPHFTFGRTPQSTQGVRPPSPLKLNPVQALRTSNKPAEDVDDARNGEDEEMLDHEQAFAIPTTELLHRDTDERLDLPFSPKRRRVDEVRSTGEAARMSPGRPTFQHPTTHAARLTAATPHFVRPQSIASSAAGDGTAIRRPAFLRSSVAPSEQEPLPDAFSPHRRGEKFVPGGMAASLQQWVVEAGQAAMQSRKGFGYLRGEEYVLRVTIVSVSTAGSPLLARGKQVDGTEIRLLLVMGSRKPGSVSAGSTVGVRAPTWQILIDGVDCTVGVDWRLL